MSEGRIQKGEAMKSLKRVLLPIVFLGVCLLCACGEKKPEEAAPTATPTPLPEYKEYDYAEGKSL